MTIKCVGKIQNGNIVMVTESGGFYVKKVSGRKKKVTPSPVLDVPDFMKKYSKTKRCKILARFTHKKNK